MARIQPHYSLCPLVEETSFLGLTRAADDNTVLVTTNCNIVGRYQVSDPKVLSSWNSKGSITSACIYDTWNDRYVAIFNHNEIRIWTTSDENIDKVKKYKFAEKLFKLAESRESKKILLVFYNGNVFYLDDVLEDRKNAGKTKLIDSQHKILSCNAIRVANQVITILFVEEGTISISVVGISPDQHNVVFSVKIKSVKNTTLRGYCVMVDKDCHLFTLWSDGKLYGDLLYPNTSSIPTNYFLTVGNIDLDRDVVMKVLSPYYIAICGTKDNGIALMIYSVKYNLIQCHQFYENCYSSPRLWCFESKLFLIMGHNLVVVPYTQESRKLSTLIGSNTNQVNLNEENMLAEIELYKNLIPEILNNNDAEGILKIVGSRCDISDFVVIDVLLWCLQDRSNRCDILDTTLRNYSINDVSRLRTVFNIDSTLNLLDYIMNSLNNSNFNVKLISWASLLIDAFYSPFIISNNSIIIKKLETYVNCLKIECDRLNEYKGLATVLSCVQRRKIVVS